jgi:hypothetical protein
MDLAPIIPILLRLTSLRLILHGVYCMGLAPILPLQLRLLVHDWYYMKFTAWASLPYFQYYSIYWFTTGTTSSLLHRHSSHTCSTTPSNWFMTCTTWSLLHKPRSHTSSTTPSTRSWLILRGVYCMGLAPIHPIVLHLLVHDWYYMEFTAWALLPYFH